MEYLSKSTVIRIINDQRIIPLFEREYLQEHIKLAKAADVAEVKHGEWRLHPDGSGTCNQCGRTQKAVWDFDNAQEYCGKCSAKMDGGKI